MKITDKIETCNKQEKSVFCYHVCYMHYSTQFILHYNATAYLLICMCCENSSKTQKQQKTEDEINMEHSHW